MVIMIKYLCYAICFFVANEISVGRLSFHSFSFIAENFFFELLGETNFSRRMSGRSAVNGDGKNMSDYKNHGFYIHISHTR